MKQRFNPVIVGAFVLGGLLLGAIALLSFGGRHFFQEPYRFVVLIHNVSVSGLDPGSPVKLSGVRVGRVESVSAAFNAADGRIVVRVVCDLDQRAASTLLADGTYDPHKLMWELIASGLHAKLNFGGITGALYLDLVMDKTEEWPPVEYEADTAYPIVPLAPSLLSEVSDTLNSIATGLASIDFAALSQELKALLTNANAALDGLDLKPTLARIDAAAGAVETLAANPDLRNALAGLNDTMQDLRRVLAGIGDATPKVRENLDQVLTDASAALRQLNQTAASIDDVVGARSGTADNMAATFDRLQRAALAIERLAEYLERNPGSLLRGRGEPASASPTR